MATAKDIVIKQIDSRTANELVRRLHYSGKVAQNSQLHLGVFLNDKLEGAMQFGPSLDKRKIQGLVSGTQWHEFVELNRMAFSEALPRNSESRALGIAIRLLKKYAPQVKWVVSFADGTQCGDGTIYRAAGFVLTAIKKNDQIWISPDNEALTRMLLTGGMSLGAREKILKQGQVTHAMAMRGVNTPGQPEKYGMNNGAASMKAYEVAGFRPLEGFQLRYIYFIDPAYRVRLTVPELPYSEIKARGASMYKGQRLGVQGVDGGTPDSNQEAEVRDLPARSNIQDVGITE